MARISNNRQGDGLPGWVPQGARHYLAHIEEGRPIRQLARDAGCHASTVLRQVRKIETRRDDPLVDAALKQLGARHGTNATASPDKEPIDMNAAKSTPPNPDEATLNREARRILRRLCEAGALLAVAADMEKAVVVRDSGDGQSTKTAVVDTAIAQAMALKEWIACDNPGPISRYHITSAGRTALSRLVAEQENRVRGFAEAQAGFETGRDAEAALEIADADPRARRARYTLAESPLAALARRRDKDGQPFLTEDLVVAGERLREDFELSQVGPRVAQNWDQFLTAGVDAGRSGGTGRGPDAAKARVQAALNDLGPGLADVALRCCCFLEGLETAEKRMGWSARSGKIVLRIALQRLKRHYAETGGSGNTMIG